MTNDTKDNNQNIVDQYTRPENLQSAEEVMNRMNSEARFAASAFGVHTDKAIQSLNKSTKSITHGCNNIIKTMGKFNENNNKLELLSDTLLPLPEKIQEKLTDLPEEVAQSVVDAVPEIATKLAESQRESYQETTNAINSSISELTQYIKETRIQTKTELVEYKYEMAELIRLGLKHRLRWIFLILMLAGSFSAVVSGITSWVVNKHFPRIVEITGNQHLVVKDSQVLVVGSDTYKLEKKKKEGQE